MFTKLHVQGFKRLQDVALDLSRITVLVGPNNAGKSSVLQLLAVLKQSLGETELQLDGQLVKLGGAADVLSQEGFSVDIEGRQPMANWAVSEASPQTCSIHYLFAANRSGAPHHHYSEVKLDGHSLTSQAAPGVPSHVEPRGIELSGTGDTQFYVALDAGSAIGNPVKFEHPDPPEQDRLAERYGRLDRFLNAVPYLFGNFYLVPDLRTLQDTIRLPLEHDPDELAGVEHTFTIQHVVTRLLYDDLLARQVSRWLSEDLELQPLIVRAAPNRLAHIQSEDSQERRGFANVGGGMQHLVHLLTQLATAPEQACIGIEEPEAHLHPKAQADLARLLAREAAARDVQLIITTHSEHLLTTWLTEVAKGTLAGDDLALYYFEPQGAGVQVTPMPVNARGQVEGGLRGFFDADVAQLTDYLRAVGTRK